MIKKTICLCLALTMLILLSGCWDYRGLNEMTVVIGIAIDKNDANDNYQLSFETVDIASSTGDKTVVGKIIQSEGKTIFEAVRNAKKRVSNKLYFGQAQVIVISEALARKDNMSDLIDWFLRDGECRETMSVVISKEATAGEILGTVGVDQGIVSSEIKKIVEPDNQITASTVNLELYKVFDTINAKGQTLVLPALHNVINDGQTICEADGIAVFNQKNRMVGYLTSEEAKAYLFATDDIDGGVLAFTADGKKGTFEISKSKTKRSYKIEDGKIKILIKTDTNVYLDEYMGEEDALDEKQNAALEKAAEEELKNNIEATIKKVQSDYGTDIFGFGNMIYKKDYRLWNQLKDNWDEEFKTIEVEVQSKIHIVNTAAIKET